MNEEIKNQKSIALANWSMVVVTLALVIVTGVYVYLTHGMVSEMKESNRLSNRPFITIITNTVIGRREDNKEIVSFTYANVGRSVASISDIKIRVCEEGRLTEPSEKIFGDPILSYPYIEALKNNTIKNALFQPGTFLGNDSDSRERFVVINTRIRYKGIDFNNEYEYENILETKIKNNISVWANVRSQRDVIAPLSPLKEKQCISENDRI